MFAVVVIISSILLFVISNWLVIEVVVEIELKLDVFVGVIRVGLKCSIKASAYNLL